MIRQLTNSTKSARRQSPTVHRTARRGAASPITVTTSRDTRAPRQWNAFPSARESRDAQQGSPSAYGFLVPSQFFTPPQRSHAFWTGEQRLLFAVLQDAVACWFRYRDVSTRRGRRLFGETARWFASSERGWIYDFERVCEMLDLDPDYIRHGLQRWHRTTSVPQTLSYGVRRRATSRQSH
jgi:hypothetical protein